MEEGAGRPRAAEEGGGAAWGGGSGDGAGPGRHCNEAARIEWSWWEREVIGGQLAYCYCSLLGFGVWVCCLTYH